MVEGLSNRIGLSNRLRQALAAINVSRLHTSFQSQSGKRVHVGSAAF